MTDLTHREREIVAAYVKGAKPAEIAQRLGIKANTVKSHLRIASWKIGGTGQRMLRLARWYYEQRPPDKAAS